MASRRSRLDILWIIFFFIECWAEDHCAATCGPPVSSTTTYEWEKYDYYRILDLPCGCHTLPRKKRQEMRKEISPQQIKKAYRKQAQIYHPDKVKGGGGAKLEEHNKRFARISEAHEVLNNEDRRRDYDLWLLNCEDKTNKKKKRKENSNNEKSIWQAFRDIVFSTDSSSWEGGGMGSGDKWQQKENGPVRSEETQEILFDRRSGKEILRIHRREEYLSNKHGGVYIYRVVVQDFMEKFVPGLGWEYQPISSPTVIEQGRSVNSIFQDEDDESQDTLLPNNYMTPKTPPLISENGHFYAGITENCELFVAINNSNRGDLNDRVKWTSRTFFPSSAGGCFLSIQGPYLLLALGRPENPGQILWRSKNDDSFYDPTYIYFARLDNDGSLVLYKQINNFQNPSHSSTKFNKNERIPRMMKGIKNWAKRFHPERNECGSDSRELCYIKATCVYATGPVGCNLPARKVIHFVQGARRTIERTISHLDKSLDIFLDLFESDGEDDDIIDTIVHAAKKAGKSIKKAGSSIAKRGARLVLNQINR